MRAQREWKVIYYPSTMNRSKRGTDMKRDFFINSIALIGNAGTAMRPLAGVLCAGQGNFVLDGTPRMRERPIDDLVDGLLQVCPLLMIAVTNQVIMKYSHHLHKLCIRHHS
jgi:EPSP synthase (3-phosphoshikimate 1-carboxyvinyltransferase)